MRGRIQQNDEAVSPILGAILILAIGITVITNVQLNFVPVWNSQEELNHLGKMNDEFRGLKSSIEESAVSGTTLSNPLSMGFKYSPKIIVYNPKESAWASLSIEKDVWAEVRYNEVLPDGMDDITSIKNITTSTITYSLQGSQNLSSFIYEHGLIRRSTSNYTTSTQTLLSNGTIYALSVNATEQEKTKGVGSKSINVYSTSQPKNSVIGKNVWLTLHTRYADWWNDSNNPASLPNQGAEVKKVDSANGIVIAHFDSMVIRMGETQVTTTSKKPPDHSPPSRLVRVSPQSVNLPVDGISSLAVEVQDYYNNPVPNVKVNFSINSTRKPTNAHTSASLLQNSAISGADGRANILLKTSGAGMYYIDSSISGPIENATFVYPASSQSGFISLVYAWAGADDYNVTATLKNGNGELANDGEIITFAASDGTLTPPSGQTVSGNGNVSTILNTSNAAGIKLMNIQTSGIKIDSATITWDTNYTVTVTANRTPGGYIFNYIDIPTRVNTTGCVQYGKSPGNYPYTACDSIRSSHNYTLTNLLSNTAYYFIVNSSRPGNESISSSEYMFVTNAGEPDTTPPSSVTGLVNVTFEPLYINWTWTDPTDADFDHVAVYVDGVFQSNVAAGVQSYNATYFMPNSTHTISTYTADIYGNVNATPWNYTATTQSMYTYVFDFLNTNGTVTNFNATNASDGVYANFTEEYVGGMNLSNRTVKPSKLITNGTQSGGAYNSSNLDAFDGFVDITNLALAYTIGHASSAPVFRLGSANGGAYTDTKSSNNVYYTLRETTNQTLNTEWTVWERFTNASNSSIVEMDIGIEAYVADGEAVYVKLWDFPNNNWNGTWHQLGASGLPTSDTNAVFWYNITNVTEIQRFVNSSGNYSIILADAKNVTGSADATRSNFVIDEFEVDFTYFLNTTNVTYTFTETNSSAAWRSISINDSSYGDALANVSIFNATSRLWESILTGAFSGGSAPAQHVNVTVGANGNASSYDSGSGQIKLRYNWTGSTTNNSLGVDIINVTVVYFGGGLYRLNVTTNTTDTPNATTQVLQVGYNVSNGNFSLQVWNGTDWNNRTYLNETSPSTRAVTLQTDELLPDGTLGNLDKFYVLVRYLEVNASPTQQDSLYLDYQRVYSN